MPTYDYECSICGHKQERLFKIAEAKNVIACDKCSGTANKKIVLGHGGVLRDDPIWLKDAVPSLQDDDLIRTKKIKPIETRQEYKKHLADNGIFPIE